MFTEPAVQLRRFVEVGDGCKDGNVVAPFGRKLFL